MQDVIVGIDPAVTGPHRAAIVDRLTAMPIGKSFPVPRTYEGMQGLLARVEDARKVVFVMEPTQRIWKPMACHLTAMGHLVYVISPDRTAELRQYLRRHTKSDRVDAVTLAKQPLVAPEGLNVWAPGPTYMSRLRDLCRHRDRLASTIGDRKRRIESLIRGAMPTLVETLGEHRFRPAWRALMRKYVDPFKLVRLGRKRLERFARKRYGAPLESERVDAMYAAAVSAVHLYQKSRERDELATDFDQVQMEIGMELDLMETEETMIAKLDKAIRQVYDRIDPAKALQTLPGIGPTIAPGVLGETGLPERFSGGAKYRGFVSLVPRKKQTSKTDKPHQRIRKSGPRLLKKYYYLAADNARQRDVEFAAQYHRLRARGLTHKQAVCALASKLASRALPILKSLFKTPRAYEFRDLNGKPIDKPTAREQVCARFPGPRAQRRSEAAKQKAKRTERAELCTRSPKDASKRPASEPLRLADILSPLTAAISQRDPRAPR
jgi:transposase